MEQKTSLKITFFKLNYIFLVLITILNMLNVNVENTIISLILLLILNVFTFLNFNKIKIRNTIVFMYIFFEIMYFLIQLIKVHYFNPFQVNYKEIIMMYSETLYLLLIFPLCNLLYVNHNKIFKMFNNVGLLTLLLKTIAWYFYNIYQNDYNLFTFLGGKTDWLREINGISFARMGGSFLNGFMFVYALSIILNSTNIKRKLIYFCEVIYLFFYTGYITQSRAQIIFYTLTIVVLIFYKATHTKEKIIAIICVIIFIAFLLTMFKTNILTFISSFSINGDKAASTSIRLEEYNFFPTLWKQYNIFTGFGFTPDGLTTRYYVSDMGIMINLYQLGIIGFLLAIIPFILGIYTTRKVWKRDVNFDNTLYVGLTIYYLISMTTYNPYLYTFYLLLPIYISFTVFLLNKQRKENNFEKIK